MCGYVGGGRAEVLADYRLLGFQQYYQLTCRNLLASNSNIITAVVHQ